VKCWRKDGENSEVKQTHKVKKKKKKTIVTCKLFVREVGVSRPHKGYHLKVHPSHVGFASLFADTLGWTGLQRLLSPGTFVSPSPDVIWEVSDSHPQFSLDTRRWQGIYSRSTRRGARVEANTKKAVNHTSMCPSHCEVLVLVKLAKCCV